MRRFAALALALCSLASFAQTNPQPAPKPKVQNIDFDKGSDITGEPDFPLGVLYDVPKRPGPFKSMIKVRENFNDKLYESVNEM